MPPRHYMGTPGGGVWKTVNSSVVWTPIFDQMHVDSIGAIAVAQPDPNIIYVGTGDVRNVGGAVNMGKGMYKSLDAGKTWQHIGLEDSEHIGSMWGHSQKPGVPGGWIDAMPGAGVYKTTDVGV
jgi:hypothetical protein